MKTYIIFSLLLLNLFALCAHGGEVEQFIRETLEEQRARSECEPSEVAQIVGDAINDSKLPEFELPKKSIFTSEDKENDARYYSYDKSGRLISVEYAASPEKNEYYAYDKQGNILEKRIGNSIYKYTYDTANQLMEMESPEGKREYFYDRAGRLIIEKFNGEIDVEYKYGYLDKVIEVNRRGKITKFAYDGFGMLAQKTFHDGSTEVWVWDGLALIRRGSDIYVNEPHVSGGVPILSKTDEGVRYHEHDFLGTTLWSMDTKGNLVKDYQDTTIFGEGSIQKDRSARFTGKPYDEDLQAYVFPYRNYDASTARWRSSDPAGYPDGINNQFYACVPTLGFDTLGLEAKYKTISATYTISSTWTEKSIFSWGASFDITFSGPLPIPSVTISPGFQWEKVGDVNTTYSKTQPQEYTLEDGWEWNDSAYTTSIIHSDVSYQRGTHKEPIYGPSGYIIDYIDVYDDHRTGYYSITVNWSRIAVEM